MALQSSFNNGWIQANWGQDNAALFPLGGADKGWETFDFVIIKEGEEEEEEEEEIVGLEESADEKMKIYPNPANHLIYMETKSDAGELKIFDVFGKERFTQSVKSKNSQLDISHLPKGIYVLIIGDVKRKFIKQ